MARISKGARFAMGVETGSEGRPRGRRAGLRGPGQGSGARPLRSVGSVGRGSAFPTVVPAVLRQDPDPPWPGLVQVVLPQGTSILAN